jgi:phosphoglycolate phosphatase
MKEIKGIIFDMDNTLLRSKIDFPNMKLEVFRYLSEKSVIEPDFPLQEHTIATLIEYAKRTGKLREKDESEVWRIVSALERKGMRDAGLEPYAGEVLQQLRKKGLVLALLTNNAQSAAISALSATGIFPFFGLVVGREQMASLKPSPSGVYAILTRYPQFGPAQWISVGDSWIDGKAAQEAQVPFIAYRSNRVLMAERGVQPIDYIRDLRNLLTYFS